jgi:hypothetical protein
MTIRKWNRLEPKGTRDLISAVMRGAETRLFFHCSLPPHTISTHHWFHHNYILRKHSRMCQVPPSLYHGPFTRHIGPVHTQIQWTLRMRSPEMSIPMKLCNYRRAEYTPHKIYAFRGPMYSQRLRQPCNGPVRCIRSLWTRTVTNTFQCHSCNSRHCGLLDFDGVQALRTNGT